jgi:hypothetical protein
MTTNVHLTRTDLERALTPEQLKITMLIRVALMLSISIFYAVIYLLYAMRTAESANSPDTTMLNLLSVVHAVFAFTTVGVAFFLSNLQLRKERLLSLPSQPTPEQFANQAVSLHRVSSLLLMAPIQGAAFFGAAICIIGVQSGAMELNPMYWLNATSGGIMLLVGMLTFPTRERVLETLEAAFIRQ